MREKCQKARDERPTRRSAARVTIVRCFSLVIWAWFNAGRESLCSVDFRHANICAYMITYGGNLDMSCTRTTVAKSGTSDVDRFFLAANRHY